MLHTLYDSWQRCPKKKCIDPFTHHPGYLTSLLHINPSDGKEKEDINLQLQCHHIHLSINSTEATILHLGVRGSTKEKDKESRNAVNSLEQPRSNLGGKTINSEETKISLHQSGLLMCT